LKLDKYNLIRARCFYIAFLISDSLSPADGYNISFEN